MKHLKPILIALLLLGLLRCEANAQDTLTVNRGGTVTIRVGENGVVLPPDTIFVPGDTVFVTDTVVVTLPPLPPDTVIVTDTTTILVRDTIYLNSPSDTVYTCPPDWTCEPPEEPAPESLVRYENTPKPTSTTDPQSFKPHLPELLLATGTLVIDFELTSKTEQQGIFSKDHSGYGTGGHLSVYVRNDSLTIRHQDETSSQLIITSPIALGEHRLVYTFGPSTRATLNGVEIGTGAEPRTFITNEESTAIGQLSWDDAPGTNNIRRDGSVDQNFRPISGRVSLVEIFGVVLTDAEAQAVPRAPFDTGGGSPPDTVIPPPEPPPPGAEFPPLELLARSGDMRVSNLVGGRTAYDTTRSYFLLYAQRIFEAETLRVYVDGELQDSKVPTQGIFPAVVTESSAGAFVAYMPPSGTDPFDIPPHNPMTSMSGWSRCTSVVDCGITTSLQRQFYRETDCSNPFFNVDGALFCDFSANYSDLYSGTIPADGEPHVVRVEALVGSTAVASYQVTVRS
jgi:hypothetical protein